MRSKDIIKKLKAAGYELSRVRGSHHHFRHPGKPGVVTVPHPESDMALGTIKSIERATGIKLR